MVPPTKTRARFIEPMLLLKTDSLPDGEGWVHELKVDGYRAIAFKTGGTLHLRSRNNNDFGLRYPAVVNGLARLPDETVIDGEVVAFDEEGRPSFNALQNYGTGAAPVVFYVFDLLVLAGRDQRGEILDTRRALLEKKVLPKLTDPVRYLAPLNAPLPDLIASVKAQAAGRPGCQTPEQQVRIRPANGCVAEDAHQSGAGVCDWRLHARHEDLRRAVFGYYEGDKLIYVARTRNGFTPATRVQLFKKFKPLESPDCPFVNLPETKRGRWGRGLTKDKMKECVWLKPVLVAHIEFLEWTGENHLRHSRFVGLREDKTPREVRRE